MAIVKDLGMVTAYAYAVAGGYEGTEAEFTEMLGQAGVTLEQLENLTAVATTLSEGSEATASYSDGVLTFGIPRGNTGATGPQGPQGVQGETGNGIASIAKTATAGLVDTSTITFTDGTTTTFEVTNGADGDITNVAAAFDSTKAYSVGDMVLYQGTLYAFTAAHPAGAWVGIDAQAVILADEVTELKDDLSVFGNIDGTFETQTVTQIDDKYAYYSGGTSRYNGRIQDSSGRAYVEFPVSYGDIIKISTRGTSNTSPCVFYTSETVGASSFMSALPMPSDSTTYTDYEIIIPVGCKCVVINTANKTVYPISIKKFNVTKRVGSLYESRAFFDTLYVDKAKEIHVASDGSGDYTTIRAALDSITDNSAENPYNIIIHTGTYNVFSDYTQTEIENEGFVGPMVKEGISLIGYDGCGNVILNGELDASTYSNEKRNTVSTLNMIGQYCRIEGLTIKGKNIRYAVHDDLAPAYKPIYTRIYKNCVFVGDSMTAGGSFGNIAFGAGTNGRKQMYFENCTFEDVVLIHTSNNNTQSSFTRMDSCKGKVCKIGDNNSTVPMYFLFNGCNFELLECYENSPTHNQFVRLNGTGGKIRFFDADSKYVANLSDSMRYQGTEIEAGYSVKVNSKFSPSIATARADVIGISVGYIDGDTFVQSDGYISTNVLGLSNVSIGDYVGIDENGQVVKINSAEGAVGIVKYSFGLHNNKFVKLTI